MPLPAPLTSAVQRLQSNIESAAPGCLQWYALEDLHITIAAPLRSRYRVGPPLRRVELPASLPALLVDLAAVCAALPPFELALEHAHFHHESLLIEVAGGLPAAERLRGAITRYPGFDAPKGQGFPLHLSCGFFKSGQDEAAVAPMVAQHALAAAGAAARIDRLALVHYANRTLSRVVGVLDLPLGQVTALDEETVLAQLDVVM